MKPSVLNLIVNTHDRLRGGYISPILQASYLADFVPILAFTDEGKAPALARSTPLRTVVIGDQGAGHALTMARRQPWRLPGILASAARFSTRLLHLMRSERCTLLHAQNLEAALLGLPAARLHRVPLLLHLRDTPADVTRSLGWRAALRYSDAVAIPTRSLELALRCHIRTPTYLVPNGIVLPAHTARARRPDSQPFRIGVVGALEDRKRQLDLVSEVLVPLLGRPSMQNAQAVLVGGATNACYHAAIRSAVAAADLSARIILVGEQDDMAPWYQSFDVLVSYSLREGLPRALLEAMGHAIPIVATDIPPHSDIIPTSDDGLLLPLDQPRLFIDALERIRADRPYRETLGSQGRQIAKGYELSVTTQRLELVYRHLIGGENPS